MRQAIEQDELVQPLAVQHALQVELDVGWPAEVDGIAQQAQRGAVGDDAPEVIAAVQVVLHQGVG